MRYVKTALVVTAAVVLALALAQPARADVSFDMAYSNLSQHGSWLVSAQYGHVWQPREYNRQWSPYYDGHWIYTDMGWAWVSDYEWGAIPYHYGTWVDDPRVGWVWIPGQTWAPSWVVFRTTPEYIGWAPVPPGFSVGVSINMGAPSSFVYVSSHDFLSPRLHDSFIPRERTNVFINNTTVVNNIVIQNNVVMNRGPDYRTVERATGRTIREEHIENVARVAPYDHVSREQLAVAPDRAKHGVRVAEPVPASQPLPATTQQTRPDNQKQGREPVAAPVHGNAPAGHKDNPNVQQDAAAQQQHAKEQSGAAAQQQQHNAKAQSDAAAQQQHAKAQQQQNSKAQSDAAAQQQHAKAQQQQNSKAQSDAAAQQQHAKAQQQQNSKAQQQNSKAQSDAAVQQQRANSQQQNAKPQQNSKGQSDAKAKKDQPEKKDQGGDKGGNDQPKKDSEK